ncbi:MAG: hypothetical protein KF689_12040 [Gemmatimonadaceae bacterium]|nr:hypothetical protein [Gemmatimonadaceae bacterium]MCW5827290.1 hypothetical protein [Gemmatimonadaceae bacterium]
MPIEFLILRFVHVFGGLLWVGSALFSSWFLLPALAGAGPAAAGPVFAQLAKRRMMTFMPAVAILTLLSGLRLLMLVSGGNAAAYLATRSGGAFALSGGAALLAFGLGMAIARPSAMRAGKLTAALANASELEQAGLSRALAAERRRGAIATNISMALLIIGAGGMALARYL